MHFLCLSAGVRDCPHLRHVLTPSTPSLLLCSFPLAFFPPFLSHLLLQDWRCVRDTMVRGYPATNPRLLQHILDGHGSLCPPATEAAQKAEVEAEAEAEVEVEAEAEAEASTEGIGTGTKEKRGTREVTNAGDTAESDKRSRETSLSTKLRRHICEHFLMNSLHYNVQTEYLSPLPPHALSFHHPSEVLTKETHRFMSGGTTASKATSREQQARPAADQQIAAMLALIRSVGAVAPHLGPGGHLAAALHVHVNCLHPFPCGRRSPAESRPPHQSMLSFSTSSFLSCPVGPAVSLSEGETLSALQVLSVWVSYVRFDSVLRQLAAPHTWSV